METVKGKTPNGGSYSEVYYMDDDGNVVDKDIASTVVIRECDDSGNLLSETWGRINGL